MNNEQKNARREAYLAKLRDPRWQKKRLEIMQRDEFTCQSCFDSESTLNVHHKYYDAGCDPWEYDTAALVTLCESCHKYESEQRRDAETRLLRNLKIAGFLTGHLEELNSAIEDSNHFYINPVVHDPDVSALGLVFREGDRMFLLREAYFTWLKERKVESK